MDVLRIMVERPGTFHAMLGVTDSTARKTAIYRFDVQLPSRQDEKLILGGIKLAHQIYPGSHVKFTKPGLVVVPNPARRYRRDQPCWLYFEIYNLKLDPAGRTHYRTVLSLRRLGADRIKRRGFLSRLTNFLRTSDGRSELGIESEAHGTSETEYASLQLDVHELAPGEYELEVRVGDLQSRQTARRQTDLRIAED